MCIGNSYIQEVSRAQNTMYHTIPFHVHTQEAKLPRPRRIVL